MDQSLLDVGGAAELLGVSKATVNKLMKSNGLPFMKIGKLVRFNRQAVLDWALAKTKSQTRRAA